MSTQLEFIPTRAEALRRLSAFLPESGRAYAEQRNYDFGAGHHASVSQLSPYIRHRLVLEEEVVSAVLSRFAPSTADKFIQEVFWRTYWKGWLEQRPAVWASYQNDLDHAFLQLDSDEPMRQTYLQAISGMTGIAAFDTWALELIETGYMHNHARMWFASIWIFTLKLPWQLGADFFYRNLLDGDPASNTLSWRWVGGLHTRGKTYLARPSNIRTYTNGRFQPDGLAATAPALTFDDVPPPAPIPARQAVPDNTPFMLLVTEEDMAPESLLSAAPKAVFGVQLTHLRSSAAISENVSSFVSGALKDTLKRANDHFKPQNAPSLIAADPAAIVEILKANDCKILATAYAPIGPVSSWLEQLRAEMTRHGLELISIRRDYDERCWPHATKGFFPFKEKIPGFLKHMDMDHIQGTLAEFSSEPRLL